MTVVDILDIEILRTTKVRGNGGPEESFEMGLVPGYPMLSHGKTLGKDRGGYGSWRRAFPAKISQKSIGPF